jgi:type IV pilus assembly protein PilC
MREQGRTFPELIVNMFYSGEISGKISEVASKMASYYMSEYKLRKRIDQATAYPKLLAFMTAGVIVVLFAFVVPNILVVLEGHPLPLITQFMKNISDLVVYRWYYLLLAAFLIFAAAVYIKENKTIRYYWDKFILGIWYIGPLLCTIYTARFARTLSSMYGSGIQLVTAIGVSSKIIGNLYVETQFPEILRRVRQGELLSAVMASTEGFNNKLKSVIVIGEETGKLDEILEHASASFEYDADMAIEGLLSLLLPVLLIVIAVIIASVIISVMLPIYQLYETLGSM